MVKRSGLAVEEFQEDAHQFKPSRWLESNGQPLKNNPKGFMPFGGVSRADRHIVLVHAAITGCSLPLSSMDIQDCQSVHTLVFASLAGSAAVVSCVNAYLLSISWTEMVKVDTWFAGSENLSGDAAGKDGDADTPGSAGAWLQCGAGGCSRVLVPGFQASEWSPWQSIQAVIAEPSQKVEQLEFPPTLRWAWTSLMYEVSKCFLSSFVQCMCMFGYVSSLNQQLHRLPKPLAMCLPRSITWHS